MFEPGMVQTLVEGVRDTLYMVLASTAFGYLLGLPLGILLCITGENGIRRNPVIYRILDIVVNLIRSVPFLILLILVSPFTKWLVGKSYGDGRLPCYRGGAVYRAYGRVFAQRGRSGRH